MRFLALGVCVACWSVCFPCAGRCDNVSTTPPTGEGERPVDFRRDIRPLLSDRCFACHGPDGESLEANLSLHLKESVFGDEADSGEIAVVPGDASASELVRRILSEDEGEQMPPPDSDKQLTDAEKQLIRRWVHEGASWEEHWAYIAPLRPELPDVNHDDWCHSPIDRFILAKLEEENLRPAAQADPATLLRRATFDLTGLPPTLKEVDAFLADRSPDAYEHTVDRLIASSAYGEHMARFWLDAARYSDTHGMHYDKYREIWPYRDWVIRAYNDNLPFDQFTIDQLAGDLIQNPTNDQLVATGFSRCHVSTSEGGSIEEEVHVRNVVDRVVTTNLVFMASTFDCTRCHDHKFDPFTMKDFYSQFAFFNSIDGPTFDGNVKDSYPITRVPHDDQLSALAIIDDRIEAVEAQQAECLTISKPSFMDWVSLETERIAADKKSESTTKPDDKLVGHFRFDKMDDGEFRNSVNKDQIAEVHGEMPIVDGRFGNGCRVSPDTYLTLAGPFDCKSNQPFSVGAWVRLPAKASGTVLAKVSPNTGTSRHRGYTLSIDRGTVKFSLSSDANRYDIQVITESPVVSADQWHHLFVSFDGSGRAAGLTIYVDGILQALDVKLDSVYTKGNPASTASSAALCIGRRSEEFPLSEGFVDDVRIYQRQLTSSEVVAVAYVADLPSLLATPDDKRTESQTAILQRYFVNAVDQEYIALVAVDDALRQKRRMLVAEFPTTLVFRERAEPRTAYVLNRGEYDQHGEEAPRAVPSFLPTIPEGAPLNRLGFARWLVSPDHPLTSRVQVNRYWQQVFGTGIVASAGDFGSQGTPPSHPELLDWLAVEFRESGWDVKAMMKTLVMSSTYRQSSRLTDDPESKSKLQRDSDNRLLARASRYRLDGEMIRDQALAVSGLLFDKVGGPSVKPPQPDGIWFAVSMAAERFVADASPEETHRRTLYTFIKRTAGPPQMGILDGPTRETCSVQRERTDTPIQALLLMNDPQLIEAAVALAAVTRRDGGPSPTSKADYLYRLCTSRHADKARSELMVTLYDDMLTSFEADPGAAKKLTGDSGNEGNIELAAWTMVANLVLNLDEVLSRN